MFLKLNISNKLEFLLIGNGGKDKVLKCEPGLYYDKSRDICDWRKNVNCKLKKSFYSFYLVLNSGSH